MTPISTSWQPSWRFRFISESYDSTAGAPVWGGGVRGTAKGRKQWDTMGASECGKCVACRHFSGLKIEPRAIQSATLWARIFSNYSVCVRGQHTGLSLCLHLCVTYLWPALLALRQLFIFMLTEWRWWSILHLHLYTAEGAGAVLCFCMSSFKHNLTSPCSARHKNTKALSLKGQALFSHSDAAVYWWRVLLLWSNQPACHVLSLTFDGSGEQC